MSRKTRVNLSTVKRAEVNLHGTLKSYLLSGYPHYLVPGLNFNKTPWVEKWALENVMGLYKRFPYKCDLPKPLLPPAQLPRSVFADGDPGTNIITIKNQIEDDANKILDNFQTHQSDHTVQLKKDVHWTTENNKLKTKLPRYVADLADIMEMDPDPYFQGKYNWYYSGGSLDSIKFGGEILLCCPYMSELVAIPLCSKDNSIWKPIYKTAVKCKIRHALYELKHNVTANICRIMARYKNECIFYSVSVRDGKMHLLEIESQKSKIPFVSADLNAFDYNQYCTLRIGRKIELWDMISGKCVNKNTVMTTKCLDNEWANVRYQTFNPNILTVTDRCCLLYLDTRMPLDAPVLTLCPKLYLETCEYISLCVPSDRESRYYLGATHSLLMCDDRSPEQCVNQKWTHQLRSPPLLGSTLMDSGEETLVISGQMHSDSAIILNTWQDYDDPHSYCLPKKPPSMVDTLDECQQLGKCLDPMLKSRFHLSTIGCKLITNDSQDTFIFSQNSIGDVFYQCITHKEDIENLPLINSHAYYALESWEREVLKQNRRTVLPLVVTDQVNMKHVLDAISDSKCKFIPEPDKEIILKSWKQPLDKLTSYVDILAPELLAAWDISEGGESVLQTEPHEKVLTWLEMSGSKSFTTQSQESQEESFDLLTPVQSQELISVSQQCKEVVEIVENEVDREPFYSTPKVKTKRKEVKNKNSYVAGF